MDIQIDKLEKHNIKDIQKRGIYYLFNKGELVYVGQSENIYSRVLVHLMDKCFDSFSFVEIDSEQSLDDIEKNEIQKYKPIYNKMLYCDEFKNKLGVMFNLIRRMGYPIPKLNDKIKNMNKEELVKYICDKTDLDKEEVETIVNSNRTQINMRRQMFGPIM